jgi:hypothetical protein
VTGSCDPKTALTSDVERIGMASNLLRASRQTLLQRVLVRVNDELQCAAIEQQKTVLQAHRCDLRLQQQDWVGKTINMSDYTWSYLAQIDEPAKDGVWGMMLVAHK